MALSVPGHAPEATVGAEAKPSPVHLGTTFAVLALGSMTVALLQFMVVPSLPTIQRELGATQSAVAWIVTAFLLSSAVATPIIGKMGDIFGKRRLFIGVFLVLAAGTALGGLASSLPVLIVARLIQGIGGAVFPLAFGIIRDQFPPRRLTSAIGFLSAIMGIGGGLGLVLAGPLEQLSIHWLFWFPMILAVAAAAAALAFVPESPVRAPGRVNLGAALLLSSWLVFLLLGVSEGPRFGWTSLVVLALFAAAAVLLPLWVGFELRSSAPLVDMRMMRIPAVWRVNAATLLFSAGQLSTFIVIPPFVQTPVSAGYGFGASTTQSGLFLLPATVFGLVSALLFGRITAALGARLPLTGASLASGSAFLLLTIGHGQPLEFYAASALLGIGAGVGFASMTNLIVRAVPPTATGLATGINTNTRLVGGAVGSQVVATIVAGGVAAGTFPREQGYVVSFVLLGSALALAAIISLTVPRETKQ